MNEEMVTITRAEYDQLVERDEWLSALEAAGVDNWDGWDTQVTDQLYEWLHKQPIDFILTGIK